MKSFKDSKDQSWDIEVNLQTRALVSARTGIDLLLLGNGEKHTLEMLLSPDRSFGVICALTEKQREARDVSLDDFGAALNTSEIVDAAIDAIMEATFDFFRNQPSAVALRQTMKAVTQIHREDTAKAMAEVEAKVNHPDFVNQIREALRNEPKPNATDSPESSASTPAPTPGESST